ncbi:complement C3-like, partial [Micropterus salmoides]|uniref:complement C3-like n=1 Tax=Micropterus salmoides TaxID=27706 RepID=UPI0018EB6E2A
MFTHWRPQLMLLALVKAKAFEKASSVVKWLNQQQNVDGDYGSTQATIMVYQALAEYWTNAKEHEINLDVSIWLPGRSKPDRYHFNRENYYSMRISKFNSIIQEVSVSATGNGEARSNVY